MHKTRLALLIMLAGTLAACGETSTLQVSDGTGPTPKLPEPNKTLIPTVNIAPAIGWPDGAKPTAAAGTQVTAFAEGLDHPRWLYVLPNGDVLVAETNAPPKPDDSKGIRGWVMEKVMGRAGAGVPSPNRITLLRDADHDGVAETRTVFLETSTRPSAWPGRQ
jgi:glucose/arabinose dehydrogenase